MRLCRKSRRVAHPLKGGAAIKGHKRALCLLIVGGNHGKGDSSLEKMAEKFILCSETCENIRRRKYDFRDYAFRRLNRLLYVLI